MPAIPTPPRPFRFRLVIRDATGAERDVGIYASPDETCEIGEFVSSCNHVFEIRAIEPAGCPEEQATLLVQPVL